jgi:ribosome biogenesis protein Nip4
MRAKAITNFAQQFGVQIALNPDLMLEKMGRYFLVNPFLKPNVKPDFFYAGVYLGKAKEGKFFPSFNLLGMLAKQEASRIVVEGKAAWLFICGRDVLGKSIVGVRGQVKKNMNTLVLNEFSECLGFGRIVGNLNDKGSSNQIVIKNVLDLGDFLRRERY